MEEKDEDLDQCLLGEEREQRVEADVDSDRIMRLKDIY